MSLDGSGVDPDKVIVPKIEDLLNLDPYLRLHEREIRRRYGCLNQIIEGLDKTEGGLLEFAKSYKRYGIHAETNNSIRCLEWAPNAEAVFLRGDFNDWNRISHPFKNIGYGKWELLIPPNADGSCPIPHLSKLKIVILTKSGEMVDRLCPWATYVVQPVDNFVYDHVFWNPPDNQKYTFKNKKPDAPTDLKIYEAHVGIASEQLKVASYTDFKNDVIPRIKKQGYNAVQLMAIAEHAYYGMYYHR